MKKLTGPARLMSCTLVALTLSACASLPASGPSTGSINGIAEKPTGAGIKVIDLTDAVARNLLVSSRETLFSEDLGEGHAVGSVVGKGDVLDVAIWEAPPAALFGMAGGGAQLSEAPSTTTRGTSLPEQMVDSDGQITLPFVGRVQADGRTPQEIARDITARLVGKAHQPQAIVRVTRNASANVTVVGDVVKSTRMPLTSRGERILDALAMAGGVKQPVSKMTLQITRGVKVASLPLDTVIRDPSQNVRLQPDDVMTVLYQPYSFTALGAVGRNEELPFEATGLTLVQALGRVSGLQDARANVQGVFIFRLEDPSALSPENRVASSITPAGKVPVIYRINLKDPSTFFIAQSFQIRNKDLLYVSNAPMADIQKFLNVIFSTVLPAATTAAVVSQ